MGSAMDIVEQAARDVLERMFRGLFWGVLFVAGVVGAVALLLLVIALVRLWRRRWAIVQEERQERRRRYDADGTPRPAYGRGLCDVCQKADEQTYHLSDGRRLCPACYPKRHEARVSETSSTKEHV